MDKARQPGCILVVDDEPSVRSFIGRFLRSLGHCVVEVDAADAALAILANNPVTLALVDALLPDTNGAAIVRHISARYPETRVVLMSGEERAWEAIAAGAQGFLSKPFELSELAALVNN